MTAGEQYRSDRDLIALSKWIDAGNSHRDSEAILWGRIAKISEEAGEAVAALIGMTGQNPRKGVTHQQADVESELFDVAITALAAIVHIRGNRSDSSVMTDLDDQIASLVNRAGLTPEPPYWLTLSEDEVHD